jgi:hypothetical protein
MRDSFKIDIQPELRARSAQWMKGRNFKTKEEGCYVEANEAELRTGN